MNIYIYEYMCVYVQMYKCLFMQILLDMCKCAYVCTHVCTHVNMHIHLRAYVYICMNTYVYMHPVAVQLQV